MKTILVSKIKKGDRIKEDGKTYSVVKKGRGFSSGETKLTVNIDPDLDPLFEQYFTYPKGLMVERLEEWED